MSLISNEREQFLNSNHEVFLKLLCDKVAEVNHLKNCIFRSMMNDEAKFKLLDILFDYIYKDSAFFCTSLNDELIAREKLAKGKK